MSHQAEVAGTSTPPLPVATMAALAAECLGTFIFVFAGTAMVLSTHALNSQGLFSVRWTLSFGQFPAGSKW